MALALTPAERTARYAYVSEQRAKGVSWGALARHYGVSEHGIMSWFYRQPAYSPHAKPKPGLTARRCLCCHVMFPSTGPGNRLCDRCRNYAHSLSPMAADPGCDGGRMVGVR